MSNITDWIKYELYPNLFDSIDRALPEHEFKKHSGGWRSKTYLNGSTHKDRIDKTVVTKKAPGLILEQGGEVLSLVDYVVKRDQVEFIQAVKTLADVIGLELPKGDINTEDYKEYKDQSRLLEDCNSYFIYCLDKAKGGDEVKAYLNSRGYSSEDVKAMELGYIISQDSLNNYLLSKGHSQSLINEVVTIKKDTRIGSTHNLTIPYRSGGSIKGFKFRTIGEATPKYLNSSGMDKTGGFFNLLGIKGDKDVVIVEGELDSLHATVKGVENVVATGGSSINSDQVKDAIKRGAKSFTICFDNEPSKEDITTKRVTSAIEIILREGVNKVYIVTLPNLGGNKTDPDRLIKESGVDRFKTAIAKALPYYEYNLQETLNKYIKIEESNGMLTYKDKDNLLDEIVTTASTLDPLHKEQYTKAFTSLEPIRELGITEESLAITVDRLTSTRDKEAQAKEFKKLLTEATKLQDSGEVDKALELLDSRVKEVKLKDKATEFSNLLKPIKEDELRQRQSIKPESLKSGFTIGGEDLLLPSGAISVFTAPTSHGKTTFLINLALNVAKEYKDKETYLFSYEEDSDSILINALNTFMDEELSGNNRTTLKNNFAGVNNKALSSKKDEFFKELIDTNRLNIHYTNYNSDTLIEAIRYLKKNANPGAIFIDYMQLLNLPEGKYKTYSRQEEMKQICIALKDIAVETGLPIILGAQFNREVTNLTRIHATKIGEAGDIERIANLIVGFWNNNFNHLGTEGELNEINAKGCYKRDTIYTKVLKNRAGVVGQDELLSYNGNTGKISNQSNPSSNNIF
jgi:DNA primase catalytic core